MDRFSSPNNMTADVVSFPSLRQSVNPSLNSGAKNDEGSISQGIFSVEMAKD